MIPAASVARMTGARKPRASGDDPEAVGPPDDEAR